MRNEPIVDPVLEALSGLRPAVPRALHERRVRRQCHGLLTERRTRLEQSARRESAGDVLVAASVALYLVAVVTEAVRLLGAAAG